MNMNLHDLVICNKHNRITKGHQEFLKFMLCLLGHRLVQKNNKLCTITKFNISLCLCIDLSHSRTFCLVKLCIINLFAKETIICTMVYFQKSLSTGIHYSCFFQNRQHLRCLCQSFLRMSDHALEKCIQILCCLRKLYSLGSSLSCNSKDCSFLRFHDCLICSLHTFLHGCRDVNGIQFLTVLNTSGKTTQKLRKNNT